MQIANKIEEKYCIRCKIIKDLSKFGVLMSKKGPVPASYCKDCKSEINKKDYRNTHKKKKIDYSNLIEKKCTNCLTTKPIKEFNRIKTGEPRRTSWCKTCKSAASNKDSKKEEFTKAIEVVVKCSGCKEKFIRTPSNHIYCKECHEEIIRIDTPAFSRASGHWLNYDDSREIIAKAGIVNTEMRENILAKCKSIDPEEHIKKYGISRPKERVSTIDGLIKHEEEIEYEN